MFNKQLIINLLLLLIVGFMFITQAYTAVPNTRGAASTTHLAKKHDIIVILHGLLRTSWSMYPLKRYLENQGYRVYSYSYPSTQYTIRQHGVSFNQFIQNLLANNPGVKINFITHSLGGIISREALAKLSANQLKNIGCLIMLAPPNQGSKKAQFYVTKFPKLTSLIKPLSELSSDSTSYVHHVPVPKVKIGIIAGRYDAKVPPTFAYLDGQAEFAVIDSNHTFIMNNAQSKKLIMSFLKRGTFR